ncbi:MAG: head GIN domain-containing protein [Chryseolinea sp.]
MRTPFRLLISAILAISTAAPLLAQEISKPLKSFRKIVVSPRINLVLEQGDQESIRLVYDNVTPDKINIEVSHQTLRVYLDDAKVSERQEVVSTHPTYKRSIYHNTTITAYVTYREIEHLEIRGNQVITCNSPILAERFTLKAYGENDIKLASVRADYLRTSLYGVNDLHIQGGKAEFQKYKLFGENRIDAKALKSYSAIANSFGESRLKIATQDNLKVNAFGESEIEYFGDASVNKGLIFGETQIHKLN